VNMQEAFDRAAKGIIDQGEPAMDENESCTFRMIADDGTVLRCNVGQLIDDDEYRINFELGGVSFINERLGWGLPASFLTDLQQAHDDATCGTFWDGFMAGYKEKMQMVAHDYGLNDAILNTEVVA
jgi:hypothetical protein